MQTAPPTPTAPADAALLPQAHAAAADQVEAAAEGAVAAGHVRTLDLRGRTLEHRELRGVVPRAALDVEGALAVVRPICDDVRARGVAAVLEATERFDGVRLSDVRVPAQALLDALAGLDPAVRAALEESIRRARLVHADQRRTDSTVQVVPGGSVTERWVPVERVGLYVPGGLAVYPSSVVMNVVPAQEAGVEQIAVTSPAQKDFGGLPHPTILAACALLGVQEVYAVGGAQAVAMFAYGARDADGTLVVPGVDIVTGPGNIYVAAAKRLLKGVIGIDSEAGPTEIGILADDTAVPAEVAADLISQAEHDPMAGAVLVTPSLDAGRGGARPSSWRRWPAPGTGTGWPPRWPDRSPPSSWWTTSRPACRSSTPTPRSTWRSTPPTRGSGPSRVRNAGAVFVGRWAPVSLGDYCAGLQPRPAHRGVRLPLLRAVACRPS